MKKLNWPLWAGFLLSVFAFLSYPLLFVRYPVTRDFPWANLLFFVIALALVVMGLRRAFSAERSRPRLSKIAGAVLGTLSVAIIGLFIFTFFVMGRSLPASSGAPQAGKKAPDFTLPDTSGRNVSLGEVLSQPINGRAPKGALLIFYRGYW